MDIDDALKAGHCIEPDNGMQAWAEVAGIIDARASTRRVMADFPALRSFLLVQRLLFMHAVVSAIMSFCFPL